MKNILITGVNGFIGTHCYNYFLSKGDNVYGIDIFPSDKKNCITGSITKNLLESFNVSFDLIIHLAGSGSVSQTNKNPLEEEKNTIGSTQEILNFIKEKCNSAKLLYASSAAVYGNNYNSRINENEKTEPFSTYGIHKLKVEQLLKTANENLNLNICIIRFFSVYGEGLKKQVLWDFSNRLLNNFEKPEIQCFGTGEELRDFVHISDVVRMFDFASNLESTFEILNCGTGVKKSIKSILNEISLNLNYKGNLIFENCIQPGNPLYLVSDISKTSNLGYKTKVKFEDGLKKYIYWVKETRNNE